MKLGSPLVREREVDSTMRRAREAVERGAAGVGAVFVAESQTAGRGRHGRMWESPAGRGLYLTAVLPGAAARPAATLAAAVAVARAVERVARVDVRIKWPNDLLTGGRKLGGILAEVAPSPAGEVVLLGVGVNVSHGASDFAGELAEVATSLELAGGRPVDLETLLGEVLAELDAGLEAFAGSGFAAVAEAYRRRSVIAPGDRLEVELPGEAPKVVTFRELDGEGRLVVEEDPAPLANALVRRVRRRGSAGSSAEP